MPSTLTFSMNPTTAADASQYMVPNMAALKLQVKVVTFSEIEAQKQAARKELFNKIFNVIKIILIIFLVLLYCCLFCASTTNANTKSVSHAKKPHRLVADNFRLILRREPLLREVLPRRIVLLNQPEKDR